MLVPPQLVEEMQQMANDIMLAQNIVLGGMKRVVMPIEGRVLLPKLKEYESWKVRAEGIRNRNFELMKKVLNLRAKVLKYFYFSARRSNMGNQEEYNLAMKEMLDHKDEAIRMRSQLLQSFVINPTHKN